MKKLLLLSLFCLFSFGLFAQGLEKVADKQVYKTTLGTDEVIIGDEKSVDFKPQICFTRWNKENSLSIKLPDGLITSSTPTLTANKIEISDGKIGWYANPDPDNPDNFKFGNILYEIPDQKHIVVIDGKEYYQWSYDVEGWENYYFWYQKPWDNYKLVIENGVEYLEKLDEPMIGSRRKEDVQGSFAIYHKTKKNHIIGQTNYETGKIFHDYRPKYIDANGDSEWAILNYKDGIRTISLLKEWADKAVYPIKANDTLGTTSIGANNWPTYNRLWANPYTTVAGGTAVTFHACSWGNVGDSHQHAIYSDNSNVPAAMFYNPSVQVDSIQATKPTQASEWTTYNINPVLVASTKYWLAYVQEYGSNCAYDDGGLTRHYMSQGSDLALADPFVSEGSDSYTLSLYITYTPSGGGKTTAILNNCVLNNALIQ